MWTDVFTPLRWCYRGLLLLLQSTVFLVPTVLLQGRVGHAVVLGGRSLAERVLNRWSGFTCRVFGIRTRVYGEPQAGPVLVVANHISWADIQALHSVAAMSFVGKAEIAEWPLMGYLASKGKTIYHRRGSHDSANGVVAQMLAATRRRWARGHFSRGRHFARRPHQAFSRAHVQGGGGSRLPDSAGDDPLCAQGQGGP